MKIHILSIVIISMFLNSFSQTIKSPEPEPDNMVFVPAGSFSMMIEVSGKNHEAVISVDAFWMSNEITNSEYREFVDYARKHPDYELCWFDYKSAADHKDGLQTDESKKKHIRCIKYSDILIDIIDFTKLPYPDYFSNRKYDNYPVVGISQLHASCFCVWKTESENEKLKMTGKPAIHDYRLPLEAEWAYVAHHADTSKGKNNAENIIRPVKYGKKNKFGLYNFAGNVSEWTASQLVTIYDQNENPGDPEKMKIIRGGSWKTSSGADMRMALEQDSADCDIGFRIVRSYGETIR